jgi:restriction system protein
MAEARRRFALDAGQYADITRRRDEALSALKRDVEARNQSVTTLRDGYRAGDPNSVASYFEMIFSRSTYPEAFPRNWRVCFVPSSRQLVVDFEAPTFESCIPTIERYKYVKSSDQISEGKRSQKECHALYLGVIAQLVLRHLHEVFRGDREEIVQVAALNAFVDTIDPSTGQPVKPHIASVRTTREQFDQLDLANVEPLACLKRLSATVSRSPAELVPIKPIVDIDMVDPRFVQEADVLSSLDQRPNLMELTPGEFESLTTNLFEKMGLEAKLTQASRDGGVDCVAWDPRPVLGGKVVVQAKRYKNTVGVSAVRDLYGTMINEGASKGILLTTSGYGKAAFEFANGKPIELLDGNNLLYLLKEHAGIDAKIVAPDDWIDPTPNR